MYGKEDAAMSELKYWIWLSRRYGYSARDRLEVLKYFGTPEAVYFASEKDYTHVIGGNAGSLLDKSLSETQNILEDCQDESVTILTVNDTGYPTRLKNIEDPPMVLYVKGNLPVVDEEITIGVVGARKCSAYGDTVAWRIGHDIARDGGLVVSGLAEGIDSMAALGALLAGGRVVGVLGCGIDVVYPAWNRDLYEDVEATGALVSEYPPHARPNRSYFPARNRIISGLSLAVTVVEASRKSGAMITAGHALEQGRDVFAVPGNIDSVLSAGANKLLQEGAQVALSGRDIIEPYLGLFAVRAVQEPEARPGQQVRRSAATGDGGRPKTTKKPIDNKVDEDYILVSRAEQSEERKKVLSVIDQRMHIDEIIEKTGLAAAKVLSELTLLEIEGAVTQEAGKYFVPHFKMVD